MPYGHMRNANPEIASSVPQFAGCEALFSGMGECDSNRDGHWSTDRYGERGDVARLVRLPDLCQELVEPLFEFVGNTERPLSHSRYGFV